MLHLTCSMYACMFCVMLHLHPGHYINYRYRQLSIFTDEIGRPFTNNVFIMGAFAKIIQKIKLDSIWQHTSHCTQQAAASLLGNTPGNKCTACNYITKAQTHKRYLESAILCLESTLLSEQARWTHYNQLLENVNKHWSGVI